MRQRHALGRAGGAAGELDVDRIVELQRLAQRRDLFAMARSAHLRHVLEGEGAGCLRPADLNDRAQMRQPFRLQVARLRARQFRQQRVEHLHVFAGLEFGGGDQRGTADLAEREFQFAEPIGRIDGDEDQAGAGGGELRQRPFRPVQRPDADACAGLESEREKASRKIVDARREFAPGPAHVVTRGYERLAVAPSGHRALQCRANGFAEQRRIRGAADVAVEGMGHNVFLSYLRHCEERSDEAIQFLLRGFLDCFAESVLGQRGAPIRVLAMTVSARQTRSLPGNGVDLTPRAARRGRHRRRIRTPRTRQGTSDRRTAVPASESRQ